MGHSNEDLENRSLSSKMFKIAVYIVTTLALAQQSYGLSKCYTGAQTKGESQLTETACSTDCVKTSYEVNGKVLDTMYCDGYGTSGRTMCSSQKDTCAELKIGNIETTVCCCSS